jgi:hypothetical protein
MSQDSQSQSNQSSFTKTKEEIMTGKPPYQRIGRNDAIYDDGEIKLKLTVEAYKDGDSWGEAVYLSEIKPPLRPDEYERVANNIRKTLAAEGRLCSIE